MENQDLERKEILDGLLEVLRTVRTIDPARLDTVTVNTAPLSFNAVAGVVYVELVAPLMATPFLYHWYVSGPVPLAETLNVAVCPTVTVWLTGWLTANGVTAFEPSNPPAQPARFSSISASATAAHRVSMVRYSERGRTGRMVRNS